MGRWNGQQHTWRDLPGDRVIEFGGCVFEQDKQNYKGRPHDLLVFDELPDFTETQYLFICAWNRTTIPGQRVRIVNTGNPPSTVEGEWVIRRWSPWLDPQHPHPARPTELRWFAVVDGREIERENSAPFVYKGETLQPKSRTFIPGEMIVDLQRTGYMAQLQLLPEPLRSQLLYGDFSAGKKDDAWQVIPTAWVRLAQQRWHERPQPQVRLSAVGADISRGGDDKTVIAKRYGNWFAELVKHPGHAVPDGPTAAALIMKELPPAAEVTFPVNLDVIGVGGAAYDALKVHIYQWAVPINVSEASGETDKSGKLTFRNLRAQMWWKFREALDPNSGEEIALPPDPELLTDLCATRWKPMLGKIAIEEKEETIKRIGRSPDCGEAVLLSTLSQGPALIAPVFDDFSRPSRWGMR